LPDKLLEINTKNQFEKLVKAKISELENRIKNLERQFDSYDDIGQHNYETTEQLKASRTELAVLKSTKVAKRLGL
jgi:hypothetical protein